MQARARTSGAVSPRPARQPYPPDVRRRLKILNVMCYLIATTTLLYAIQQATTDFHTYAPMVFVNLALVVTALMVPFAHRISEIAGGLLLVGAEYAALFAFTDFFSREGGAQLQYIIAAAAPLRDLRPAAHPPDPRHRAARANVCTFSPGSGFRPRAASTRGSKPVVDSLYTQAAITTVVLIAASVYYAFSLAEQAKAETDAVLRNVLPDAIVERLKAKPGALIADSIEDASVMFADISGFVALTRRLGANATVDMLSRIVSEFDALAVRHGVEKIKTIGDAYMVVAGLPEPVPDHTARLARMGLDMLAAVARMREESGLESQPAYRHGVGAGDRRRHRHAQVQLRRVGRSGEPRQPARRAVVAGPHTHLPRDAAPSSARISSSRRAGRSRSRASARRRRGSCSARARRRPAKTGAARRLHRRTSLEPETLLDALEQLVAHARGNASASARASRAPA